MPSGWLTDTAALYARVFKRGALLALRNWAVGPVVVLYFRLLDIAMVYARPLGMVGGLLIYLATVACFSSGLYLVAQVVQNGRVRLADLPAGFTAYLVDLLTVGFLIWGLRLVASLVLAPFPFLLLVFLLATVVFLNAVPELIYLGRHAPAELLVESYRFISENWIEWFPANIALACCVFAVRMLPPGPFGLLSEGVLGIVLYFAMIVRGLLFLELTTSSRRAREFRRRVAS
jgi:hypothetical protein